MKALLRVDEGPIREKLQNELAELSRNLEELERGLESYFSRDLPQYQSWLNHHFSDQLSEINLLEKKVSALGHHLEESVQLSVKMNLSPEELFANWSEDQILEKILKEDPRESPEQEDLLDSPTKISPNDDSREIYRRIARSLHPDVKGSLTEAEKNLWVKAQKAYSQNDSFELSRIEDHLRSGNEEAEPLTCSEMLRQLDDFKKKYEALKSELTCIRQERAWNFCAKKCLTQITRELTTEHKAVLRDLKSKEEHLHKTLQSWLTKKEKVAPLASKPKRRVHKSQESLF